MGMLQELRGQRASIDTGTGEKRVSGQRAAHVGRGTFVNKQKDLGINTDESTAQRLRADNKEFEGLVAEQSGKIDAAFGEVEAARTGIQQDLIPVKFYHSSGKVTNYNLTRDTAEQLYNNPDNFAVFGQDPTQDYVPIKIDQSRYHDGTNKNLEYYNRQAIRTQQRRGGESEGYRTTTHFEFKPTPGDYKQNVLHLKASSSKASHPWAEALDDIQRQTDAKLAQANTELDTTQLEIEGAKGMLEGTVKARDDEWKAARDKAEQRRQTMMEILGGLNFG